MDMNGSLEIPDSISVMLSTKNMIPIPLLVFHLVQVLGTAKCFINFITKENNCVFLNFMEFLRSIEFR